MARVRVDRETSMAYVRLTAAKIRYTEDFGDHRLVDYDEANEVVGVEFIGIKGGADLDGLPEAERVRAALIENGCGDLASSG